MFSTLLLAAAMAAPAGDTVVIVLDNSGSMRDPMGRRSKIDAAAEALDAVLEGTPEDTVIAVLLLNPRDGTPWLVPLPETGVAADRGNREAARRAVESLRARGSTKLGAAMKTAADALLARREADPRGDHRLLIVSDGESSDANLVDAYLPQIQARGLGVDVIGVAMSDDHALATRVGTYRAADDAASLRRAVNELVQSETTGDVADGDVSDFDLISGLPADVAAAALSALAEPSNLPLAKPARRGWFDSDPAPANGNPAAGNGRGGGIGFGTMLLIAFIGFSLFRAIGRQRRASR